MSQMCLSEQPLATEIQLTGCNNSKTQNHAQ